MLPFIHLDYPVDKAILIEEAHRVKLLAKGYTDNRFPELVLSNWLILRHTTDYIEKLMKDFDVEGSPRFYWLNPYATIPEHIDNGTLCSLNFILTDHASPITIQGEDHYYEQILLNTSIPHSVTNYEHERIMLKISIFNETFEHLSKRLRYKKNG